MKKHEIARDDWSIENVLLCAARQKDILKEAWKALNLARTRLFHLHVCARGKRGECRLASFHV